MYKVLAEQKDGFNVIELTDGPFMGCQVAYGELSFGDEDEDGSVQMHFNYNIVNNYVLEKEDMEDFQNYLGATLLEILEDTLAGKQDSLIFHGGTDENAIEVPLQNIDEE